MKDKEEFIQISPENGMTFKLDLREGSLLYTPSPTRQARCLPVSIMSYGTFNAGPEHYTDRDHFRCLYQVFWTRKGCGHFLVGEKEFFAEENSVALLNCGKPHRYEAMKSGWEYDWVNYVGSAGEVYYNLINPNGFKIYSLEENREIPHIMYQIRDGASKQDMLGFVHTSTRIISLLDAIYTLTQNQPSKSIGDKKENILESARYIDAHYAQKLTLDTLAEAAFLSKFYYNRAFKRYIGMTPVEYVNSVRISHAKNLLVVTDLSIDEIGWRVGFGGSKNLIYQFKKETGMTPGEFRRQIVGWDNAHAGAKMPSEEKPSKD